MYIDFYTQSASPEDLLWRGTCKRDNLDSLNINAASLANTEKEFLDAMLAEFEHDPDHYVPLHGWPHPYPTSADTDVVFVFSAAHDQTLWHQKGTDDWFYAPDGHTKWVDFKFKWPEFAPNLEPYT